MKVELNDKEVILVIGALSVLDKVEPDSDLDSLRVKITKQHIEEMKNDLKKGKGDRK